MMRIRPIGLCFSAALLATALDIASLGAQARGAQAPKAPVVLDSTTLEAPVRSSWTSDKTRYGIGDIITILIDERTLAAANLTDNASDSKKKQMGLDIAPPAAPGGVSANMSVDMGFNQNGDSRKSGTASRQTSFKSELSVRVVAVSPSGMLKVAGHKTVNVDKNLQDVVVTGWLRPQDIASGSNTVESSRLADAEVNYVQKGGLGTPKSGIVSRVLGAIWP